MSEGQDVEEKLGDQNDDLTQEEIDNYNSQVLDTKSKNILWSIIKQIKVGSTIKHLQLPTFVLQPCSLLERLADLFSYSNILCNTPTLVTAEERFINVVRFYLSGIHIRPKGVKNPLNPIIGEFFTCEWQESGGTFIAEQISHHPPHSAIVYHNKKAGIAINGNFIPSYVKYYGNSAESIVNGYAKLVLLSNGEEYIFTWPSVYIKGIIVGHLTMELLGKVVIRCGKTKWRADIEFKKKSLFGNYNEIHGKIKHGDCTAYTVSGFWDKEMFLTKCGSSTTTVLFAPEKFSIEQKCITPSDDELVSKSQFLRNWLHKSEDLNHILVWADVIKGIIRNNEAEALSAKTQLENKQRQEEQQRQAHNIPWVPKRFVKKANEECYEWKDWEYVVVRVLNIGSKLMTEYEIKK